ncbi:MAG: pyridoxine 5'-phosphate synthase [Candidatus Dadabacteria bacterium]|nr:MAG: pyridoxine 5'-phosphate synthase [Candidatus Dadabacteria bacterium]
MIRLGVNIDHVATVRQARRIREPDPVWAVVLAELGGADQITLHLREDRRHIQDEDLERVLATASVPVNLEMAVTEEMLRIAAARRPHSATLVPEKREEITTEGGLDVAGQAEAVRRAVDTLAAAGIRVSLFIDPDPRQVEASVRAGARAVELHTGAFCEAWGTPAADAEFERLRSAARLAAEAGLAVHAGHGLNVRNVRPVARIPQVEELNIGHSLVGRAIFVGLQAAVAEMKAILAEEAARR